MIVSEMENRIVLRRTPFYCCMGLSSFARSRRFVQEIRREVILYKANAHLFIIIVSESRSFCQALFLIFTGIFSYVNAVFLCRNIQSFGTFVFGRHARLRCSVEEWVQRRALFCSSFYITTELRKKGHVFSNFFDFSQKNFGARMDPPAP